MDDATTADMERRGLLMLEGALAVLSLIAIYLLVRNGLGEFICAGMCSTPPTDEEVWRARGVSAVLVCTVLSELAVGFRRRRSVPIAHCLVGALAAIVILVFAVPLI